MVEGAILDVWAENASLGGISMRSGSNAVEGSMFARSKYRLPSNVVEEIKLARDLMERDDSCSATMGTMIAAAFSDPLANFHEDEATAGFFDAISSEASFDRVLREMYREYLIAGSVTTVHLFSRKLLSFMPREATKLTQKQITMPYIGVLPAENIRVRGDDVVGNADLLYVPDNPAQEAWLREFFSRYTTPARRAEMRREEPVWAAIFTDPVALPNEDLTSSATNAYRLNPKMVRRTTMPKGAHAYPRPPLTANFALLEAKRLLSILDYALLQGGTNYIVVAKKGSDQRPALPAEVANLASVVRQASRTGVIVGDHRLNLEVITPDLSELLNPVKRSLIDRKLAMRLMRVPEHATLDAGVEGQRADMELLSRVVTADRADLERHMGAIYQEIAKRNPSTFTDGPATLWLPKIVLTGQDAFNQQILKLRDRGDIPRKWAVEAAGFNYEASVAQRKREIEAGDDEVLTPGNVPFDSPQGQPGDQGRPPGSSPANGAPGQQPTVRETRTAPTPSQQLKRTRGETVRAWYDEREGETVRVGEQTYAVLEEFAGVRTVGRLTAAERAALDAGEVSQSGPLIVVPVNPAYEIEDARAVRLEGGVSMLVGRRVRDHAVVAKALCFRDTRHTLEEAQERALRWGFPVEVSTPVEGNPAPSQTPEPPPVDEAAAAQPPAPLTVVVNNGEAKAKRRRVLRGDDGEIVGVIEEPADVDS